MSTGNATPATLLARGLALPPLSEPPKAVPPGTVCAITGVPITHGYPVGAMTSEATTEFLDCFRGGVDGYVEDAAARCFKSANPRQGNPCARSHLAFLDTYFAPLIAREPALAQGRPCWSDLVRAVWPARAGHVVLALITTDTKKRLWHKARTGALGHATPLYYYDSATLGGVTLWIDWPDLLDCLDLVEEVYALGASKAQIRASIYGASALTATLGLARLMRYERALDAWRVRPEFTFATLIAQRPLGWADPLKSRSFAADSTLRHGEDQ